MSSGCGACTDKGGGSDMWRVSEWVLYISKPSTTYGGIVSTNLIMEVLGVECDKIDVFQWVDLDVFRGR